MREIMKDFFKRRLLRIAPALMIMGAFNPFESWARPHVESVEIGSDARDPALIYSPKKTPAQALPLVLLLHGYGGSGKLINFYFRASKQLAGQDFILIVPNGIRETKETNRRLLNPGPRFWNATDYCCDFKNTKVDDVKYLNQLLDYAEKEYPIDPKRIYIWGHSNGGFMAYRMACEMSSRIRAIASFAGVGFLDPTKCQTAHPVSILHLHGTEDDTIKFEGTDKYPSAIRTVENWLLRNQCDVGFRSVERENLAHFPVGRETHLISWSCREGSRVAFWKMVGAEHSPLLTEKFTTHTLEWLFHQK